MKPGVKSLSSLFQVAHFWFINTAINSTEHEQSPACLSGTLNFLNAQVVAMVRIILVDTEKYFL